MPVNSVQYGQEPWKYANGLKITNDAVAPDTIINVAVGSILDSAGIYQIVVDSALSADVSQNGLNGLDTGTFAVSKVYAIHVVADPVTQQANGLLVSLSATAPLLPFGYSAFALVGYLVSDSSADILLGFWTAGNSATREFFFDAPILALDNGAQTGYTGVALTAFVPAVANTPVVIYSDFTANAAADVEALQGYNQVGDAVTIIAPVAGATAHTTQQDVVLAQLNSGAPSIKYKVSAGTVDLYVCGYKFFI